MTIGDWMDRHLDIMVGMTLAAFGLGFALAAFLIDYFWGPA